MFTGIISDTTTIKKTQLDQQGLTVTFVTPPGWQVLQLGESISTSGVCLSVASIREHEYDCLLVPETLNKSTFGTDIPKGVNLERALRVNDRFGGHFIQGHVDGVGKVSAIDRKDGHRLFIEFDVNFMKLVIPKGSIAIDGVSLTIASVNHNIMEVALIPLTLQHTTLADLTVSSRVNLEFDMIGKYIVNMMEAR